jgi:hypothetical protein
MKMKPNREELLKAAEYACNENSVFPKAMWIPDETIIQILMMKGLSKEEAIVAIEEMKKEE